MNSKIERPCETLSVLKRLKDNLCDLEEIHSCTFGKRTTVHIGAEQAQSMQEEYEEERSLYNEQMAVIEGHLRARVQ